MARQTAVAKGMIQAAAATAAFGLLHSALASRAAKEQTGRLLGERRQHGLYRAVFAAQSCVAAGALLAYVVTRPGRELYRARGPARLALHAGQAAALGMTAAAVGEVGAARLSGAENLTAYADRRPIPPGPAAQGPESDARGRLTTDGPFRLSRHPLNFWPMVVLWLWPRMTTNLLALNFAATAYLVIGSRHEEARLRAEYGEQYENYRRGVPFYVPSLARLLHGVRNSARSFLDGRVAGVGPPLDAGSRTRQLGPPPANVH